METLFRAVRNGDLDAAEKWMRDHGTERLGEPLKGRTALHVATLEVWSCFEMVELLVRNMDGEQVSVLNTTGDSALDLLWSRGSMYRNVCHSPRAVAIAVDLVKKMPKHLLVEESDSYFTPLAFACGVHLFRVVDAAIEKFGISVIFEDRPLGESFLAAALKSERPCFGGLDTILAMINAAPLEELRTCAFALNMVERHYPHAVVSRLLERQTENGEEALVAVGSQNVLHIVAQRGDLELLEAVTPFLQPAHLRQQFKGNFSDTALTPTEIALQMYSSTNDEKFATIAARLQPMTTKAACGL